MHTEVWADAGSREYREALAGNRRKYTRQCSLWPLVFSMAVVQDTALDIQPDRTVRTRRPPDLAHTLREPMR